MAINSSFNPVSQIHSLVIDYNIQNDLRTKTTDLENIDQIVKEVFKEEVSQQTRLEIKNELKQIKLEKEDSQLWNQIFKRIENNQSLNMLDKNEVMIQKVKLNDYSRLTVEQENPSSEPNKLSKMQECRAKIKNLEEELGKIYSSSIDIPFNNEEVQNLKDELNKVRKELSRLQADFKEEKMKKI